MSTLGELFGNPQELVPLVGQQIANSTVSNMPEGIFSYGAFTLQTAQQIAAAVGTRSLQFLLNAHDGVAHWKRLRLDHSVSPRIRRTRPDVFRNPAFCFFFGTEYEPSRMQRSL